MSAQKRIPNPIHEICMDDIVEAMTQLKSDKSCSLDGLCPEAFKCGGKMLVVHLKFLFNMFLAHSFLPECLTMTTLVPLLKNKSGDIADVNNCITIVKLPCQMLQAKLLNVLCWSVFNLWIKIVIRANLVSRKITPRHWGVPY